MGTSKIGVSFFGLILSTSALLLCNVATAQFALKVVDAKSNAAIEDVLCIAQHTATKKESIVMSDARGLAHIPLKGRCTLTVKKLGFKTYYAEMEPGNTLEVKMEQDEIDLKDIVVTGQYATTTRQSSINTIKIIDRKKLDEMGANNLRDALTNQLNVRISQDNVLGSSASINGISGQNIKILVDGVPVIGRTNGNVDLTQMNLSNVERIEIVEGPMSVIYGSDALGGVINLISKRKVKEEFNYVANGYYESNGTYNADGRFAFKHKNVEMNLSGGRNFFGGYSENYDWQKRTMQWKPRTQLFTDNSISFKIKQSNHTLFGNFFDEKIINRGAPTVTPYSAYGFDEVYHTIRWGVGGQSDIFLKGSNQLQFINSYSHFTRIKNTYRKNLVDGVSDITTAATDQDTSKFQLLMFRGVWTNTKFKKLQHQAGYDFNIETGSGERMENNKQIIQDYALFYTIQYTPIEKITMKAGVRGAYNSRYGTPVVPSFNLKYAINKKIALRASYAMGYRAPSLKELSLFFVDINHNIKGNNDLKAERSHNAQLELSYEPTVKDIKFGLKSTVFFNHLYNMISLALLDPAQQLYTYINVDKFQSTGVNLNTSLNHKYVEFQLGYSYTGRYNQLSETAKVPHFNWASEVSSSVSVNIPKINTSIAMFYKFNGMIPGYALDAQERPYQTAIQSYSMLDASVTVRIWKSRFAISGGAKNLLNVKNINYNVAAGTAHSGGSNSMSIGMGITGFASIKINLTNDFGKKHE